MFSPAVSHELAVGIRECGVSEQSINPRFHGAGVLDYDTRMPKRMPGYELLHLLTAAQMVERLPAQARVLVVGAGTGQEILRLARARPDWQFTAADVSPDMLALAQQNFVKAGIADRVQLHAGPFSCPGGGCR